MEGVGETRRLFLCGIAKQIPNSPNWPRCTYCRLLTPNAI